jgi:hypothetical protein
LTKVFKVEMVPVGAHILSATSVSWSTQERGGLHMVRYHRLTLMEREELSRMLAVGASLWATARQLGCAPSTLARELVRQRMSPYIGA